MTKIKNHLPYQQKHHNHPHQQKQVGFVKWFLSKTSVRTPTPDTKNATMSAFNVAFTLHGRGAILPFFYFALRLKIWKKTVWSLPFLCAKPMFMLALQLSLKSKSWGSLLFPFLLCSFMWVQMVPFQMFPHKLQSVLKEECTENNTKLWLHHSYQVCAQQKQRTTRAPLTTHL